MENMGKLKLLKGKNSEELCKIVLPPLFTFVVNSLVYWGAPLIVGTGRSHNLSGGLDELVPFMPAFIIIYFGCYIFWVVNYLMVAFYEDENKYRFYTADFYARLICLAFFVLFPTTNTRPELTGNGIFIRAMRFLYTVDKPVNLLPSIHCMASWFCCIGLRKCKEIPEWYKLMSVLIAISVFISTLATRQHGSAAPSFGAKEPKTPAANTAPDNISAPSAMRAPHAVPRRRRRAATAFGRWP